jgi:hypothetical protein
MKKLTILLTLTALLSVTGLQAQAPGAGAATASDTGSSNNWQNWTFAGCALATAAAGIFVVAMGNGESSSTAH